jgi:hypothetical protein
MDTPDTSPTPVVRIGSTVGRPAGPGAPAVHALLRHLEAVGFSGSPRVVGDGYDADGRQVLTYLEGASIHPHAWSDEGVWRVGRLLRDSTTRPPASGRPLTRTGPPGSSAARTRRRSSATATRGRGTSSPATACPPGFIDWEFAGPIDRLDEIAATGWWNAQLHDDEVAELSGLPDAATRVAQLGLLLDGYGLASAARAGLVTRMIEFAIRDCAKEAIAPVTSPGARSTPITPESTDPQPLWSLAWRARAAAWMLRHRPLLERAVGG